MERPQIRNRACIVGAGAAGLCAIRNLSRRESQFECHVYEKGSNIGGQWRYTDLIGLDQNGLAIHTSMYKNLRSVIIESDINWDSILYNFKSILKSISLSIGL